MQVFVERALRCERLQEGKGRFWFTFLRQLGSEQGCKGGMGFVESFPLIIGPPGVLVLGEQRASPQLKCCLQFGDHAAAAGGSRCSVELINVDAEAAGWAEADHIVAERDRFWPHHASDGVDDLVQVVGRHVWLGVRPQPIYYDLAVQPMSGREGQQLHQYLGLAQPPPVWHRLSVDRDGETTQQRDVNLGCYGGLSHRRIFPRSDQNEKRFVRTRLDMAACLASFGLTETLQR